MEEVVQHWFGLPREVGDGVTIPGQEMTGHGTQCSALLDVVKVQPQV